MVEDNIINHFPFRPENREHEVEGIKRLQLRIGSIGDSEETKRRPERQPARIIQERTLVNKIRRKVQEEEHLAGSQGLPPEKQPHPKSRKK